MADNSDGLLSPGSFAQVRFELPPDPNATRIPASALIFRNQAVMVAKVDKDGRARLIKIHIAHIDAHLVDVGDGEERLARRAGRQDQRADIDVARSDDAVERRRNVGERLQRFAGGRGWPCAAATSASLAFASPLLLVVACCETAVEAVRNAFQRSAVILRAPARLSAAGEFTLRPGAALVDLGASTAAKISPGFHPGADIVSPVAHKPAHMPADRS